MLKTIYRSYDPKKRRFYGFALPEYQDAFHEEHPNAYRCPVLEVTADQLALWRNTGAWEEDFQRQEFIPAGRLLRWPIDEPDVITESDSWDAAHMSVKHICRAAGLTQTAAGQRFGIPWRTFSDWCRGVSKCPDYIRLMMCELLGIFHR
ncbi:MAG: helix-turn-helix transcriptional regulator [Oscillospiraceae bacterium]|nr:helix-turn-helix transcriptional regulator [Oscillospiraceae bacterium]